MSGRRRARIAWRGEVGSVVSEDRVDLVRNGGEQAAQEVRCGAARHLLMHLDESELRRPVDGDDEVEFALRGSNFGDVDMKLADRALNLRLGDASPSTCGSREIP
jgi:hypothetical protein